MKKIANNFIIVYFLNAKNKIAIKRRYNDKDKKII